MPRFVYFMRYLSYVREVRRRIFFSFFMYTATASLCVNEEKCRRAEEGFFVPVDRERLSSAERREKRRINVYLHIFNRGLTGMRI